MIPSDLLSKYKNELDKVVEGSTLDLFIVETVSRVTRLIDSLQDFSLRSGKQENFDNVCKQIASLIVTAHLLKTKFESDEFDRLTEEAIREICKYSGTLPLNE